jgi:hypothetical protein
MTPLGNAEVEFLQVLAELNCHSTYTNIVEHSLKIFIGDDNYKNKKRKLYARFRKAKQKLKTIQENNDFSWEYFKQENNLICVAKDSVIHFPRTSLVILEFLKASRTGEREVKKDDFEKMLAAKYEWEINFITDRMKAAKNSGYIAFNETSQEYSSDLRLSIDIKLIKALATKYATTVKNKKLKASILLLVNEL